MTVVRGRPTCDAKAGGEWVVGAPLHAPLERLGVLPRQPQDVVEQPGCEVDAEGHCTR